MDTLLPPPPPASHPRSPRPSGGSAVLLPGDVLSEPAEDPDSPGPPSDPLPLLVSGPPADPLSLPLAFLGGSLIALLTLLVPLATVVVDRRVAPLDGSPAPVRLPDPRP
ncbi:MAG: hypothetical protein VKI81_02385 [Synechococcaceae cyanobacterium]|nr:hypothetical protein [Synechococcaceae cyanobacterium]